ncbi:MAG: hypothetical protein KC468_02680 [Myxococcales bacterium]|nr:hypothetical protein [Myxococcales bacterium]
MRTTRPAPIPRRRRRRSTRCALALALAPGLLACTSKQPRAKPDEQPALAAIDGLDYVPVDATAISGLSVKAAYGSWLDRWFLPEEVRALQRHASSCDVDLTRIERAVSATGDGERNLVVLVGPRVGELERLRCIHDAYVNDSLEAPFRVIDGPGGAPELEIEDYGSGFIVDDRALVLSSPAWADAARQLAQGVGQRAVDGRLRPLLDEVNQGRELWFVASIETNKDAVFPVDAMFGGATISAGLELELSTLCANEQDAAKVVEMLGSMVQVMPTMLSMKTDASKEQDEVNKLLQDAVEITQKGARAHISIQIARAPMELFAARIAELKKSIEPKPDAAQLDEPLDPPAFRN